MWKSAQKKKSILSTIAMNSSDNRSADSNAIKEQNVSFILDGCAITFLKLVTFFILSTWNENQMNYC